MRLGVKCMDYGVDLASYPGTLTLGKWVTRLCMDYVGVISIEVVWKLVWKVKENIVELRK